MSLMVITNRQSLVWMTEKDGKNVKLQLRDLVKLLIVQDCVEILAYEEVRIEAPQGKH